MLLTRILVRIFNHKSFPVMTGMAAAMIGVVLFQRGLEGFAIGAVGLLVVGLAVVWHLLRTQQSAGFESLEDFCDLLNNGVKPTLVEFYSEHCAFCSSMKPVVDRLEREAGRRLQVLRLDIDQEPGKTLMADYDVLFTPTFIEFDRNGRRIKQTVGLLHRARMLYELKSA